MSPAYCTPPAVPPLSSWRRPSSSRTPTCTAAEKEKQEVAKEKLEEELVEQEHIFHYNTVRSGISEQKAQYSGFRISTVVRAAIKDHLESPSRWS